MATTVPLGTAATYGVLANTAVTNTGSTVVTGDLGVSPAGAVTGFPPGTVTGTIHVNDAAAAQAQSDLQVGYANALLRPVTATVPTELGGTTLTPGVYKAASGTFGLNGTLTLDAQGDPTAVFVFKTNSTLITGATGNVNLINLAQSGNVFWQVGSSATLGAGSTIRGSILAFTSITATTGAIVDGRLLAAGAAVTLDSNAVTVPPPVPVTVPTSTLLTSAPDPSSFGTPKLLTATVTSASGVPTGTVSFFDGVTSLGAPQAVNGVGVATLSVSTLSVGSHSLTAVYNPTGNFLTSTSPVDIQTVTTIPTSILLTSAPDPSSFGTPKLLTATVTSASGVPTGTVSFFDGVTSLGAPQTVNGVGVATLSVSTLSVGTHSLTAVYNPTGNFATSTSPVDIQTVTSDRTQLTASPALLKLTPFPHLEYPFLTATLTDLDTGQPIPGQVITFTAGTNFLGTATTDATGKASLLNPLAFIAVLFNGGYTVTFAGSPGHQPATGQGGFIVV
ncbi:DUF3494 domain-containing protein [Streptomyces inhibens]|uniref:DUF3494 domain-containing protein n=1 Tax=Streptomyces inhibens TaxID=2293571 RepID=A0A371Q909_STRIH|nr:ice-binding family protein [Streptomyces inhibens]REK90923.1 DUF3494 domain-containing protein [Streptomyces inhibens]